MTRFHVLPCGHPIFSPCDVRRWEADLEAWCSHCARWWHHTDTPPKESETP